MVGCAALRPVLELLPVPALIIKRQFAVGAAKFIMQANLEVSNCPTTTAIKNLVDEV